MSIAIWVSGTAPGGSNQAPSVPTNLTTADITESSLTLSWDASTDDTAVTGYEYRINGGASVDVFNTLSVTINVLAASTTYDFEVRAYDAQGAFSAWSTVHQATTSAATNQAPSTPANLVTSNVADTSLTLSWDASTDDTAVTGYEYRINGGASVDVGNVLTTSITGLSASTSYDLQVRAYDGAGAFSAWSTALTQATTGTATGQTFQVGYIENTNAGDPMLTTDTGDFGVSTFAAMVNSLIDINGNDFQLVAIPEATLVADVATTLSNIDILFVGSAIEDYTGTPAAELEAWVKAGGTFICYSDNGLGGGADNGVGQDSRNSMGIPSWAGFEQARDQKDNIQTRTLPSGNFLAYNMTTRNIQGEGMSPFVIDATTANHPSQGYPTIILTRPGSPSLPKPLGLTFTGEVAELCYSRPGLGLFFGIMDRQLLLNGPASNADINSEENEQFLKNLLFCGSGAIAVPSNFDQEWAAEVATMSTVFDLDPSVFSDGPITVNDLKGQYPSQMNDWKNHLEGSRGPLLQVGDKAGRKMIEVYRPKYLNGESTDVWFRKILGQSHPNALFPQMGVGGDIIRHEYSMYFPLHSLQGGTRGHICPKTVKMIGGPQGETGVGNTGENPQPAGMYEFVPTVYNHKPYYSNPNAKGDWKNTVWDVNGDYGPAVTLDPSSYQQLTHFGIASYLYDPRSAVVGHPFQEMFYMLYWDEVNEQLTNVRRPFKPDTLYDIRMEVQLNTRTEISPGVYNDGNNDGILRVWIRENNGAWVLGREETDLNIRGNGINTDYHPTNPVPFGDAGYIDFTGGSGFSYNLVADSGLVSQPEDSWWWHGGIYMWVK
jgi:chitodextrinase